MVGSDSKAEGIGSPPIDGNIKADLVCPASFQY